MPSAPRNPGEDSVEAYLESLNALHERLDEGMSFSGNERNRVFLNCGMRGDGGSDEHEGFANISAVSGLDFADDARGLAFFDWDHDGDLDLALSNRTAPRLRLMRNATPVKGRFVSFVLEGDGAQTSRDAIGARVTVETSAGRISRTVRAGDGFLSQSSRWLHFGLGQSTLTGRTIVRWPGAPEEEFGGIEAGRRYRLMQGHGHGVVVPPTQRSSLVASIQEPEPATTGERVVLATRPPAPALTMRPFFSEDAVPIALGRGGPVLINFWASWCGPCRTELKDFSDRAGEIRSAGLDVVALSTDGLGDNPQTTFEDARDFMDGIGFPFSNGLATAETLDKVDLVKRYLFDRRFPLSLPFSVLIDGKGRVAALYRGGIDPEGLVDDLSTLEATPAELREMAVPLEGRWFTQPAERVSVGAYARWFEDRFPDQSIALLKRSVEEAEAQLRGSENEYARRRARHDLVEAFRRSAAVERKRGNHDAAARHSRSLLELEPADEGARTGLLSALLAGGAFAELRAELEVLMDEAPRDADLRVRLAEVLDRENELGAAASELRIAVDIEPADAELRYLFGQILAKQTRLGEAFEQFERAVELDPDHEQAHLFLAFGGIDQRNPDQAVEHFLRVLDLNPRSSEGRQGLARTYLASGLAEKAVPHYESLIAGEPENAAAQHELGVALQRSGRLAESFDHFRAAFVLDQRFLAAANEVAWALATHPRERRRDGATALRLAREINARTGSRKLEFLETLAAALAETGQFGEATTVVERAIGLAEEAGMREEAELLSQRLELYRRGSPLRQPNR